MPERTWRTVTTAEAIAWMTEAHTTDSDAQRLYMAWYSAEQQKEQAHAA